MKTLLLISLLLTITTLGLKAETLTGQAKIDSLLAELPNAKGDTNEVKLLDGLCFTYYSINPDKGIEYGEQALKLAKKISWREGEALCYDALAINNAVKSNNDKALKYWEEALKINRELGNLDRVGGNLGNISTLYIDLSDFPKALEYLGKALKIDEESGDKAGQAINLGNIGTLYIDLSDYPKALEYYKKSLEIDKEIGYKEGISKTLGNIGAAYMMQSEYPKALEYLEMALKLERENGNESRIANNLGNIGTVYLNQSNYSKALEYYKKSLEIEKKLGNKYGIALDLGNLGNLYLIISQENINIGPDELNQHISLNRVINLNKSIEYSLKAIKLLEEIVELNYRSHYYKNLSDAYKLKGDMIEAYNALEEYHKFKDSVFSQENSDKIAALEKAREDDLKQKEIEKQKIRIAEQDKREKLILYFSIGIVLLMAIVMIIIIRLLKRSDKLLYNVLPVSIAKRLKRKEHPISDYFTQASIVFIDIVNFTELSKDEDPRRVVEALNKIFTHYDAIANKYGLEKIKTIGDSYMAAAGIPEVQKDNTLRAAQMALEVKEMMDDYKTEDGTKIEVRIGLDCGPVVAGVIGENKFIYDMWSDAVNTASRMESSSIAGQVHVSERFKDAVTEYEEFSYVERGEIEIKGKGKMKTYFIEIKETEVV